MCNQITFLAKLFLGSWGLIDNDPNTGDPDQEDMDIIVILTKDSYFVAYYDDEVDKGDKI